MEQKNNPAKIIIVTAVIIIIFVSIIIGIIIAVNSNNNTQDDILQNLTPNVVVEEEEENTILDEKNLTIIDDETADFSRRYGRIQIIWIDENNNEIDSPLAPNLNGLIPVKFDSSNARFVQTTENDTDWYNYDLGLWANAINEDGSYFVWIPRFAYRITYYSNSQYAKIIGYCDGRGIMKLNDDGTLTRISRNNTGIRETNNHFIVAPAFSKDTASGYRNGGWDTDLPGFWTSKYEMSMETNGVHTETLNGTIGNVQISDEIKAVSKPTVSSWRNINIRNCYLNCYNYNRNRDSHLMKNTEWGAVAYLAYSKFGRNGRTITTNYKSVYPYDSIDNGFEYKREYAIANFNLANRYRGDALFETSDSGFGNDSFENNTAYYLQGDIPYLIRGGDFNSGMGAGVFSYNGYSGASNSSESFRVVFI